MSAHSDEARSSTVASLHRASRGGHGCSIPEYIQPRRLWPKGAFDAWNAANERARAAYLSDWRRR